MDAKKLIEEIRACPKCKIKRNEGYELNLCEEHSDAFKKYLEGKEVSQSKR